MNAFKIMKSIHSNVYIKYSLIPQHLANNNVCTFLIARSLSFFKAIISSLRFLLFSSWTDWMWSTRALPFFRSAAFVSDFLSKSTNCLTAGSTYTCAYSVQISGYNRTIHKCRYIERYITYHIIIIILYVCIHHWSKPKRPLTSA